MPKRIDSPTLLYDTTTSTFLQSLQSSLYRFKTHASSSNSLFTSRLLMTHLLLIGYDITTALITSLFMTALAAAQYISASIKVQIKSNMISTAPPAVVTLSLWPWSADGRPACIVVKGILIALKYWCGWAREKTHRKIIDLAWCESAAVVHLLSPCSFFNVSSFQHSVPRE